LRVQRYLGDNESRSRERIVKEV